MKHPSESALVKGVDLEENRCGPGDTFPIASGVRFCHQGYCELTDVAPKGRPLGIDPVCVRGGGWSQLREKALFGCGSQAVQVPLFERLEELRNIRREYASQRGSWGLTETVDTGPSGYAVNELADTVSSGTRIVRLPEKPRRLGARYATVTACIRESEQGGLVVRERDARVRQEELRPSKKVDTSCGVA